MKFYAVFERSDGSYVNAAGVRYDVSTVRRVRSSGGVNVGYMPFPSLEAALAAWGLRPVSAASRGRCAGHVRITQKIPLS